MKPMNLTKRTHYNPCFWTALWNKNYYDKFINDRKTKKDCRNQCVYSLNIKANKIMRTKVEDTFYENGLGITIITQEQAENYCRINFPNQHKDLVKYYEDHPGDFILDFENIFTGVENSDAYKTLLEVIANESINSITEKAFIASFIVMHKMRSHSMINAMIEMLEKTGGRRFEHFLWVKKVWSSPDILYSLVNPIIEGQWILYRTDDFTFPLNDSPIMSKNGNIMAALSPKMLLEINTTIKSDPEKWIAKYHIPKYKLNEYKRRAILSCFKEIIYFDDELLSDWKKSTEYKERAELLNNITSYNSIIKEEGDRELWIINAFAGTTNRMG